MLLTYNLLQIVLLLLCLPCLVLVVLLVPKYRGRVWRRLGCGLSALGRGLPAGRPRIWLHALSVGEVASVRALVLGLRREYPDAVLILSVTTTSGHRYAEKVLGAAVDLLVPFPLDLYWSVSRFLRHLAPDLFILAETDLWPNFLAALRRRGLPAVLVNGRISAESLARYQRLRRFFLGQFETFRFLLMQSEAEAQQLAGLGVNPEKLRTLGNLKYGALLEGVTPGNGLNPFAGLLDLLAERTIWVAGSTHPGEEEVLLRVYRRLRPRFPALYLILAPRNPKRAGELLELAAGLGLRAELRSAGAQEAGDLLLLDTMGELAELYRYCTLAFIGGSLVPERGHNPLEPAACGRPVLFGPQMEDFAEIARELLECGAAQEVADERQMVGAVTGWLADSGARDRAGRNGLRLVESYRGVTARHLELIGQLLQVERSS